MTVKYMSADEIIERLHSIKKIEHDGIYAVITFNDSDEEFVASEFVSDSFTKELFELIERHLLT